MTDYNWVIMKKQIYSHLQVEKKACESWLIRIKPESKTVRSEADETR